MHSLARRAFRASTHPKREPLYCRTCKDHFSERKGTVLEQSRLPDAKALFRENITPAKKILL